VWPALTLRLRLLLGLLSILLSPKSSQIASMFSEKKQQIQSYCFVMSGKRNFLNVVAWCWLKGVISALR